MEDRSSIYKEYSTGSLVIVLKLNVEWMSKCYENVGWSRLEKKETMLTEHNAKVKRQGEKASKQRQDPDHFSIK